MAEIEFKKPFPALIVTKGSPAAVALLRIIETGPIKPGHIYFVTEEEFASLAADVARVDLGQV